MAKLEEIEGVGPVSASRLQQAGVMDTDALLKMEATPKRLKDLATKSGIMGTLILEWVNHVDLFRIKGVGEEYADLLEEAGLDTVVELASRKPSNLFAKLEAVNAEKKLVRKVPAETQVGNWIAQAKELPRVVEY
jgi:predicted flap endonuclease-1-like 5' DNA nuclease